MKRRSPKVRPDSSPSASPGTPRGVTPGKASRPRGYLCPGRCPPGADSAGGVAILPARAQGPEPGPPGPAFLPGPLSGFKMRRLHSAPAGLSSRHLGTPGWRHGQAANLSTPCPSNHLQAQVTPESRAKCGCAPPPDLQPRRPPQTREKGRPRAPGLTAPPLGPRDPGPSSAPPGTGGKGRWDITAPARNGEHAPPHAPAPRRVSPHPFASLPLLSPGGELGRPGGRGRDAGPPPCWSGTYLPGVESAPPECGLRPPHGVNAPRSRLLEGERGGCEGLRGGKRRCCALAHCGGFQGGAEAPGLQLSAPALPDRRLP